MRSSRGSARRSSATTPRWPRAIRPRPGPREMSSNDDPLALALADLDALESAGLAAFQQAGAPEAVEAARIEFLGQKQGRVKAAQERLKALEPSARRGYGQRFNAVKQALEAAWEAARTRLESGTGPGPGPGAGDAGLRAGAIDVTL